MKLAMPSLDNITWERLERESSVTYPCDAADTPGNDIVFSDGFPTKSRRGKLVPVGLVPPAEEPGGQYPMVLTTGRQLEHWHTGAMTRRASVLDELEPEPVASVAPAYLRRMGLKPGSRIRVETRRGAIDLKARADSAIPPGMVFIPFCYVEAAANLLTNPQLDPFGQDPNVTGAPGDVSNLGDLDRLFAQIKREKGRLDIVFANAGVARYAALGTITEEVYDSIFDINVKGVLFTVQKALPLLPDGASIILNASIVASKGLPANSVYSATKAAVRSFARTWTTDLTSRRIRVNAVSPGSIDTPGLSDLLASSETGQQRQKMISTAVPLGRLGMPDEIAKAVVFLASDDSSYITGAELFVDGGVAQV